ncbi:MAG: acyl-CoA dehydrogenase family protein [Bacteroidetes bacterium]|nr:acyl-CoA dehydrogenase family protein [Bacteroidota bacterium]
MSNTPLGNLFSALNNALDSKVAGAIGLRKFLVKATYTSAFNGVNVATKAAKIFTSPKKQKEAHRLASTAKSTLFDLNLTEDQQMIQDTIKDFVAQKITPVAEHCSEERKVSEDLVQAFGELGITYYSVPEAMGGMLNEKATVTQMIITETLAYGDVGVALALLTPIGALNALVAYGSPEQQEQYIPPFLEEGSHMVASIAVNESNPLFDPFQLETKAVSKGDSYVLNGVKTMIPLADQAEFFLVAANVDGKEPQVFIVEAKTKGLSIATDRAMGLNAAELGKITLKDVEVPASAVLLSGSTYSNFIDHIRLSWCALAVGASKAALDYVIDYANSREAFGEPISHRQAVAFMIANIKIEMEAMQVLTQRAVSRAEQGMDYSKEAYLASVLCSEKAMEIGTNSVQLLGGYGFCRDYPAERWYRDLRAVAISYNGMHL